MPFFYPKIAPKQMADGTFPIVRRKRRDFTAPLEAPKPHEPNDTRLSQTQAEHAAANYDRTASVAAPSATAAVKPAKRQPKHNATGPAASLTAKEEAEWQ